MRERAWHEPAHMWALCQSNPPIRISTARVEGRLYPNLDFTSAESCHQELQQQPAMPYLSFYAMT